MVGFLCVLAYLVALCKGTDWSEVAYIFGFFHFISFVSGIIGFPIGISYALFDSEQSVGVVAILATVAVIINLLSIILLCACTAMSKDDIVIPSAEKSHEEAQIGGGQSSNISAQYNPASETADMF
jgi:hypothetical protein